jgi:hypothetical protein
MGRIKGTKITIDEVSQTIDLEKLTGVDLSDKPRLRREIAQDIIDYMVKRTQGGEDNSNKSFAKYSASYKASAEFKAAGKGNNVNLTLSGDMLGKIDIVEEDGSTVKIAVAAEETPRAFGLISGFEGHPTIDNGPKRQFFGVSVEDIKKEILPAYKDDLLRAKKEEDKQKQGIDLASLLEFTLNNR